MSYLDLLEQLQQTPSNKINDLSVSWKKQTNDTFVKNGRASENYKRFIWNLLSHIIDNILLDTSIYNMEMISKVRSFLTTWEEEAYPGIIAIQNNTRDKKMYEKYYGILLTLYESKYEKLVDPSIFVNADGSLNLGNTPVMAILKDMICGCKRGTECVRKNPDHLKLMHGLHVSPEIRVIFSCSADYPVKGGKRRKTLRKRIKQKKNKRTAKQRS